MRRKAYPGIALFLAMILLIGIFPMTVVAANDELVLTSINYSSAVAAVDVSGKNTATLTVPHDYSGTVDLSNGLDITYNTSTYTSASASFPSGSVATVGGDSVLMTVTYQKKDDSALYSTQYTINVVRASGTEPAFSGTISKSVTLPGNYTFTAADFTGKYTKNDGEALVSIAIIGSNPTFGALKFNGSSYVSGEKVNVSDIESGKLVFTAASAGTVSYTVKAYQDGSTEAVSGSAILTIAVQNNTEAGTVSYQTGKNTAVTFNTADFTNAFNLSTGKTLSYVKFTLPSATYGKLYYNYVSAGDYDSVVSADTKYYRNVLPDISHITFVPYSDYLGTVTISYTGYDTDGNAFSGKLSIKINTVNDTQAGVITYQTNKNTPVSFKSSTISAVCEKATGEELSYVTFTLPSETIGKLYYNYKSSTASGSAVSSETKYYKTKTPNLSYVSFVPAADYVGTATVSYTGYDEEENSFTGEIKITVANNSGSEYFTDIGKNFSWAKDAIDYLYKNGIITGTNNRHFNPNASIKRGDFILMLCKAFDLKADVNGNFIDVDKDSYYYNAIAVAKMLGISKGTRGRFNPNSALSRQDAMVLILRALDAANITIASGSDDNLATFSDSRSVSDYAVTAVSTFVKANVIKGNGKKINPKSSISRAEIAVILYRILTM